MEVKVSDAMPDWLVEKLSELKIYKISFSKYGRAYQRFVHHQLYKEGHFHPQEAPQPDEAPASRILQKKTAASRIYRPTANGIVLP